MYSTCPDDQYVILGYNKPLFVQTPGISISLILNFHEFKQEHICYFQIYVIGLPFQHNLYSCLFDLECFALGRFTPLTSCFISAADGLIHVFPLTAATRSSVFATLCKIQIAVCTGKCTQGCTFRVFCVGLMFQIFDPMVSFVVL